jgi:hypothetical protein
MPDKVLSRECRNRTRAWVLAAVWLLAAQPDGLDADGLFMSWMVLDSDTGGEAAEFQPILDFLDDLFQYNVSRWFNPQNNGSFCGDTMTNLQEYTIPAALTAAAGGAYGAAQAPGGSRVRGGLIGGLAGLGAGGGFSAVQAFLDSSQARHIKDSPALAATLLLGGAGLGGAAGLHGGRQLSKRLGLGSPRNVVENDLEELNPRHIMPVSLRRLLGRR